MTKSMLQELVNWLEYEKKKGNRIKSSKLFRIFRKYAKIKNPKVSEKCLNEYWQYYW